MLSPLSHLHHLTVTTARVGGFLVKVKEKLGAYQPKKMVLGQWGDHVKSTWLYSVS